MARTSKQTDITPLTTAARRYDAGMNEGGEGFNPYADALRAAQRETDEAAWSRSQAEMSARQQAEDTEWTLEVTQTRRAAWNAWARSLQGPVTPTQVTAQIKAQGWTPETLKAQIARHGL
jgi:hypothetical protein